MSMPTCGLSAACGGDYSGDTQTKSKQRFALDLRPKHLLELGKVMTLVKLGGHESFTEITKDYQNRGRTISQSRLCVKKFRPTRTASPLRSLRSCWSIQFHLLSGCFLSRLARIASIKAGRIETNIIARTTNVKLRFTTGMLPNR